MVLAIWGRGIWDGKPISITQRVRKMVGRDPMSRNRHQGRQEATGGQMEDSSKQQHMPQGISRIFAQGCDLLVTAVGSRKRTYICTLPRHFPHAKLAAVTFLCICGHITNLPKYPSFVFYWTIWMFKDKHLNNGNYVSIISNDPMDDWWMEWRKLTFIYYHVW